MRWLVLIMLIGTACSAQDGELDTAINSSMDTLDISVAEASADIKSSRGDTGNQQTCSDVSCPGCPSTDCGSCEDTICTTCDDAICPSCEDTTCDKCSDTVCPACEDATCGDNPDIVCPACDIEDSGGQQICEPDKYFCSGTKVYQCTMLGTDAWLQQDCGLNNMICGNQACHVSTLGKGDYCCHYSEVAPYLSYSIGGDLEKEDVVLNNSVATEVTDYATIGITPIVSDCKHSYQIYIGIYFSLGVCPDKSDIKSILISIEYDPDQPLPQVVTPDNVVNIGQLELIEKYTYIKMESGTLTIQSINPLIVNASGVYSKEDYESYNLDVELESHLKYPDFEDLPSY